MTRLQFVVQGTVVFGCIVIWVVIYGVVCPPDVSRDLNNLPDHRMVYESLGYQVKK